MKQIYSLMFIFSHSRMLVLLLGLGIFDFCTSKHQQKRQNNSQLNYEKKKKERNTRNELRTAMLSEKRIMTTMKGIRYEIEWWWCRMCNKYANFLWLWTQTKQWKKNTQNFHRTPLRIQIYHLLDSYEHFFTVLPCSAKWLVCHTRVCWCCWNSFE